MDTTIASALVEQQAKKFAVVAKDTEALARMLAEWVAQKWPAKVRSAYWVNVSGDLDKGFEVELMAKQVPRFGRLRGSALVGRETWGFAGFVDVAQFTVAEKDVTASVGLGAVTPYTGGDWKLAAAVSVRF